jgi:hypothetical protein
MKRIMVTRIGASVIIKIIHSIRIIMITIKRMYYWEKNKPIDSVVVVVPDCMVMIVEIVVRMMDYLMIMAMNDGVNIVVVYYDSCNYFHKLYLSCLLQRGLIDYFLHQYLYVGSCKRSRTIFVTCC